MCPDHISPFFQYIFQLTGPSIGIQSVTSGFVHGNGDWDKATSSVRKWTRTRHRKGQRARAVWFIVDSFLHFFFFWYKGCTPRPLFFLFFSLFDSTLILSSSPPPPPSSLRPLLLFRFRSASSSPATFVFYSVHTTHTLVNVNKSTNPYFHFFVNKHLFLCKQLLATH